MSHQQDQNPREETPTKNTGMEVMADQSENEVESALCKEEGEHSRSNAFPLFSRQSSVYSLTLDEFQNTLTGSGRKYGSMNMDEFLQSIWTAEESEVQEQNANIAMPAVAPKRSVNNINPQYPFGETSNEWGNNARQMSLTRQGSLSVPAPLCQRTVEEVWSEISGKQQRTDIITHVGSNSKQSDPTYGEMTLEDFLGKAGVVLEGSAGPAQPPPAFPLPHPHSPPPPPHLPQLPQLQPQPQIQLPFDMFVNCDSTAASTFMVLGCGGAGSVNIPPPLKPMPQIGGANVAPCLLGGKSSTCAYQPANSYGGGLADNGCRTKSSEQLSPISSDGIRMSNQERKRNSPVERVVEKRQKRMMKNRESAARSRARKHAYTIELEAELNQLKDENAYLRHRLAESETRSTQQNTEAAKAKAQARAKDKLGLLRRCLSSPF